MLLGMTSANQLRIVMKIQPPSQILNLMTLQLTLSHHNVDDSLLILMKSWASFGPLEFGNIMHLGKSPLNIFTHPPLTAHTHLNPHGCKVQGFRNLKSQQGQSHNYVFVFLKLQQFICLNWIPINLVQCVLLLCRASQFLIMPHKRYRGRILTRHLPSK